MPSENFQTEYREALNQTLNHLQTVNLLVAQIEAKMDDIRDSMQNLSQIGEKIATQKKWLITRDKRKVIYIGRSRNSS
ncbi:hypothetical protein [Aerosakkonema funiforme]|uniref:Uncharacterized protein n=1 Tax=Aerosakkonema funiforme FACHB-1375 TaxID=2949571 RepID=A0A926ZIE8_9CYAN|nr:hypothetical protein [Aerosakkonema funiforme]MBD2184343.1 hypothetical protein [Aerosakkonema funiforme FACHB-1375]